MHQSVVRLQGTYNFRDFGGYETVDGLLVRRGRLYRSDNLSRLSEGALPQLSALGIRLLVDFRTEFERCQRPNVLPAGHDIRVEHLPLSVMPELEKKWSKRELVHFLASRGIDRYGSAYMEGAYRSMAEKAADTVARLFELLSDPANHPALMLCAAGRDRTGFGAAMVLSALGVPLEAILHDYCLTNVCATPVLERRARWLRMLALFRVSGEKLRDFLEVRPAYLLAAVGAMQDSYGSVDGYLRERASLSEERRQVLRSLLLENRSGSAAARALTY